MRTKDIKPLLDLNKSLVNGLHLIDVKGEGSPYLPHCHRVSWLFIKKADIFFHRTIVNNELATHNFSADFFNKSRSLPLYTGSPVGQIINFFCTQNLNFGHTQ
jgi:hypothetical protein